MRMNLSALIMAACLVLPVSAHAAEYGVYVTPKIGGAIVQYKVAGDAASDIGDFSGSDGSFGGGLAVGYDFHAKLALPLRVELEYSAWTGVDKSKSHTSDITAPYGAHFLTTDREKAKIGIQSLFANVYADWHNSTAFTPYISAGVGVGFVTTKASLTNTTSYSGGSHVFSESLGSKTQTNFAWNVGLGCSYAFTDAISADLGYRFASFGSGKTEALSDGFVVKSKNNYMHQFLLGVRFTF